MATDPNAEEVDLESMDRRVARIEARFATLTEDFTNLRYEVNALEEKIERRT